MRTSCVGECNGVPTLFVDGAPVNEVAYISYFTKNARYGDFAEIGGRLYSVPIYFARRTINEVSQFPPFADGIFEDEARPNFALFDMEMRRILDADPDAMVFPRVNMNLPYRWLASHPDELCDLPARQGNARCECFSSDIWAEAVKGYLRQFIEYVENAAYAENIVGYQLACGNTEEWFSFDQKGSIGRRSREKFTAYKRTGVFPIPSDGRATLDFDRNVHDEGENVRSKDGTASLPSVPMPNCTEADFFNEDHTVKNDAVGYEYYRFLSEAAAARICELAAYAKTVLQRRVVIGSFYGYTMECPFKTSNHHALMRVLQCPDVDFLCSPVCYAQNRVIGRDHPNITVIDSIKLHGKLYFAENDTRTDLSKAPCTLPHYNVPIWFGPDRETSVEVMRLHFARAVCHGHAMWWFDMWGGWYDADEYRDFLRVSTAIAGKAMNLPKGDVSEYAVFVDEKVYAGLTGETANAGQLSYQYRETLGKAGAPYAIYLAEDFEKVKDRYKAYLFLVPAMTETVERCLKTAAEESVPTMTVRPEAIRPDRMPVSVAELRQFLAEAGVTLYTDREAVVYANESFLFLHAPASGVYTWNLPNGRSCDEYVDAFTGEPMTKSLYLNEKTGRLFISAKFSAEITR